MRASCSSKGTNHEEHDLRRARKGDVDRRSGGRDFDYFGMQQRGSDPVSACTNYCEHVASCEGVSGSQIATACQQSCADAGSLQAACKDGGSVTTTYNCLGGLPCNDFTAADAAISAFEGCLTQSGCL